MAPMTVGTRCVSSAAMPAAESTRACSTACAEPKPPYGSGYCGPATAMESARDGADAARVAELEDVRGSRPHAAKARSSGSSRTAERMVGDGEKVPAGEDGWKGKMR